MAKLVWGIAGERFYEAGVDRGVLYIADQPGVVWNGLTSVSEIPSGGETKAYYIDGVKYQQVSADEEFVANIEAFTYPDEFAECEGTLQSPHSGLFLTSQPRKSFGLSYRTRIGNDLDGPDHAYKLHLVYNALAESSARQNETLDESPNLTNFSWRVTTLPPPITGYKRTAHFVVDSRSTDPLALTALEEILYGSDALTPRLPDASELFDIFETHSSFVVIDNGDGSFTASGTDFQVHMLDSTTFEINTPAAVFIDATSYTLTSS